MDQAVSRRRLPERFGKKWLFLRRKDWPAVFAEPDRRTACAVQQ